jgi:5-formyltetrahydrofolate cyclo-ligase
MLKQTIRQEYLNKRLQLDDAELQDKTVLIAYQFSLFETPPINYLFSYYPLVSKKEFDISVCEQALEQRYPGIRIAWPKTDLDMSSMEAYIVEKDGLFAKNRFNVLEPLTGTMVNPEQLDMIFVPLLAFDTRGYRVGYGKGFYDRYLARCRPDAIKLGFSFFEAIDPPEDINEFDVPLDYCITPTRLYEF